MEHLFSNHYTAIPWAQKFLKITYSSAKSVVIALVNAGILHQINIRYKSKVFIAKEIERNLNVD